MNWLKQEMKDGLVPVPGRLGYTGKAPNNNRGPQVKLLSRTSRRNEQFNLTSVVLSLFQLSVILSSLQRYWNGELDNCGSQQLEDFSRTGMGNTALLFNIVLMRLVKTILSSPPFLYTLFLTEECTYATEPIFSLWNTSLFSWYYQMPLTPLSGLVTEKNFLDFLNFQTYSSSTWQSIQCGVRHIGTTCHTYS